MSVRYEVVPVTIEQQVERTVRQTGYVSAYRIIETIIRVIVTRVNIELIAPDGSTVLSKYALPTRYVETEYRRPMTIFLGVTRLEAPQPATPQQATTTTPTSVAQRREIETQPVPIQMAV